MRAFVKVMLLPRDRPCGFGKTLYRLTATREECYCNVDGISCDFQFAQNVRLFVIDRFVLFQQSFQKYFMEVVVDCHRMLVEDDKRCMVTINVDHCASICDNLLTNVRRPVCEAVYDMLVCIIVISKGLQMIRGFLHGNNLSIFALKIVPLALA